MPKLAICIDVPDLTAATEFYCGVLGCSLEKENPEHKTLSIDGVTIWSGGPVDDLQGAFRRGRFEGINENHWWITATVV